MKKLLTAAFIAFTLSFTSGCISRVIGVNTLMSYEKRYDSTANIEINGEKVEIPEGKSVWVLRAETVEVLLSTAADKTISKVK